MTATLNSFRRRLQREDGFTLIELLVVIVIIGILLAIAVPSYLGFKDRAAQKSADADVRAAIPDVEAYYADVGSYNSMGVTSGLAGTPDTLGLRGIDSGISPAVQVTVSGTGGSQTYCLGATVNGKSASFKGGPGNASSSSDWFSSVDCTGSGAATAP